MMKNYCTLVNGFTPSSTYFVLKQITTTSGPDRIDDDARHCDIIARALVICC